MAGPWYPRKKSLTLALPLAAVLAGSGCGGLANSGNNNPPPDTAPPAVSVTSPANSATVSGTVSVTGNASDNVGVVSVQFQIDTGNVGGPITSTPYSYSWDTTQASNGSHTITAVARDAAGNQATSIGVTVTVSNPPPVAGAMGPLVVSATNSHYFVVQGTTSAVLLAGSHTWNDFQDMNTTTSPPAFNFDAFVAFLKAHNQNATILWRTDLPAICSWQPAPGTWHITPHPWQRTGPGSATDGFPKFNLTKLDQAYFDRLRARVVQLQQNGIYAIIELFDGLDLIVYRCSADGYPLTVQNNINGIGDDGMQSSMTMSSPNALTDVQDAYVRKVIDTLHDLPNVLWEVSEEAPGGSLWWQGHMISLIHTYEQTTYGVQHPVGFPSLQIGSGNDQQLYNSNAEWVAPAAAPSPTSGCGSGTPACKVIMNDNDHSYITFPADSAQTMRNYIWENFTNGSTVLFMDGYLIPWPNNYNNCVNPVNGLCSGVDTARNFIRDNLGYVLHYGNTRLDLVKMTPQPSLSNTGFCLANNAAVGAEFIVYAPNGGTFTVNLSAQSGRTINVEWMDPTNGTKTAGSPVNGGSSSQSFTPPWGSVRDAVLYLVDAAGHN